MWAAYLEDVYDGLAVDTLPASTTCVRTLLTDGEGGVHRPGNPRPVLPDGLGKTVVYPHVVQTVVLVTYGSGQAAMVRWCVRVCVCGGGGERHSADHDFF